MAGIGHDIDLVQPWRKSFPICKPPKPKDKADAERFVREFEEGADGVDVGNGWTMGDVLRHEHDGGLGANAVVIPQNAPAQRRQCNYRRRQTASAILKYVQDEGLKSKLRAYAQNGELMWRDYKRLELSTVTEATSDGIKQKMRAATILGQVGFTEGSIQTFEQYLNRLNSSIEPPASRMVEHDVAVLLLKAIISTGGTLGAEAVTEYTRASSASTRRATSSKSTRST